MNIEQKPVELLQAQVAVYADSQVEHNHPGRQRALLANLGSVAIDEQAPDVVTYPRTVSKKADINGELVVVKEKGSPEDMFIKDEYVEFLKDPRNREISRNLADMISAYGELGPLIDELGIIGLGLEGAKQHPNYLGHGGSNMAFGFTAEVGNAKKEMVALFAQNPEDRAIKAKVNERAINLSLAKGLEGFEQGIAVSYDPPVVIAEKAAGKTLPDMSLEERQAIPPEHWDKLSRNTEAAIERGIYIDTNSDNFLYDPEAGFTVIDFRTSGKRTAEELQQRTTDELSAFRTKVQDTKPIKHN